MKSWSPPGVITRLKISGLALIFFITAAGPAPALELTTTDRADLARVEDYINQIGTLQTRFLQASSNGAYAEGTLTLSRPGKLRLEYDPPVQMLIVADGTWLIYKDTELDQVSYLPLNSTPAGIIVRQNMSFSDDDLNVVGIERGPGVLSIRVTGKDADEGSMTLVFADRPMALKKWIVVDPQGIRTSVSLLSSRYGIAVDRQMFIVKQPDAVVPDR